MYERKRAGKSEVFFPTLTVHLTEFSNLLRRERFNMRNDFLERKVLELDRGAIRAPLPFGTAKCKPKQIHWCVEKVCAHFYPSHEAEYYAAHSLSVGGIPVIQEVDRNRIYPYVDRQHVKLALQGRVLDKSLAQTRITIGSIGQAQNPLKRLLFMRRTVWKQSEQY